MTPSIRIAAAAVAIFVAAAGFVLLLSRGDQARHAASQQHSTSEHAPKYWAVGDRWTIVTHQRPAAVGPEEDHGEIAELVYRFEVTEAPTDSNGGWLVRVTLDDAEGFAAEGWDLRYRERKGAMRLSTVAPHGRTAVPADAASIVLGTGFPDVSRYDGAPKARTVVKTDSAAPSGLPPTLPSGPAQ
jgi:hypothetical protein